MQIIFLYQITIIHGFKSFFNKQSKIIHRFEFRVSVQYISSRISSLHKRVLLKSFHKVNEPLKSSFSSKNGVNVFSNNRLRTFGSQPNSIKKNEIFLTFAIVCLNGHQNLICLKKYLKYCMLKFKIFLIFEISMQDVHKLH